MLRLILVLIVFALCAFINACSYTRCELYYSNHSDSLKVRDTFWDIEITASSPLSLDTADNHLYAELYVAYEKLNHYRFDSLQFRGSYYGLEQWKYERIQSEWQDRKRCYEHYCKLEIRWNENSDFQEAKEITSTENGKDFRFHFPVTPKTKHDFDSLEVRLTINQGQITNHRDSMVTKVYHLRRYLHCEEYQYNYSRLGGC